MSNPFAIEPSKTDHSYRRYLRNWCNALHDYHLNVLSDLCDRNMEMASIFGEVWYRLDDRERAAMDDELQALYVKEQQTKRNYLAAVDKLILYYTTEHEPPAKRVKSFLH